MPPAAPRSRSSRPVRLTLLVALGAGQLAAQHAISLAPTQPAGYLPTRFDTSQHAGRFAAVSAGFEHTLALRADGGLAGVLAGWGRNDQRQCDPPTPPAGITYTAMAAGARHGAAIRSDGAFVTWGDDYLLLPSFGHPWPAFTAVAAGFWHVLILRSNGAVFAYGLDQYGQAGGPRQPPAGLAFVGVAAGANHSLGLLSDGTIQAWGDNAAGQCNVPPLPPGTAYVAADGGVDHTVALRSDGAVVCWGSNAAGQCAVPALPAGVTYVGVAAGSHFSLAVRSDGTATAWGNAPGPLPTPPAGARFAALDGGHFHAAAVFTDGSLACWGANDRLQCNLPAPPAGTRYVDVVGNQDQGIAVRSDGQALTWGMAPGDPLLPPTLPPGVGWAAMTWGLSSFDQPLGLRTDGLIESWPPGAPPAPVLPRAMRYVAVAVGYTGNYRALRSDGEVVAWSAAGPGTTPPPPPGTTYEAIASAVNADFALRSDGAVIGWPSGAYAYVPPLPPGRRYVGIAAGRPFVLALRDDGQIVALGTSLTLVPALPAGVHYVEVASGQGVMAARRSDGAALLWIASSTDAPVVAVLPPGHSARGVEARLGRGVVVHTGARSRYVRLGVGCAGSLPPATIVPRDTPRIGEPLRLTLFGLPVDAAFVITGFSSQSSHLGPLPLATDPFGIPGCTLFTSLDAAELAVGSGGVARYEVAIPAAQALVGAVLHQQALVVDPGHNAFGGVLSDAMTAEIGN